MNIWEALAERKVEDPQSAEGAAFAWLFGAVEGFGKQFHDGDLADQILSEMMATMLHDALDVYEALQEAYE